MKHFFLLPALLLSAHAEENLTINQALNHAEQQELRRFLSEDVSLFRKEPPLDLVISQARTTRILNNGYCLIEISVPRAKDESPLTFCLICRLEGDKFRLVDLIRSTESQAKCFTYTLSNRKLSIRDASGTLKRSLLLSDPSLLSLFEAQEYIKLKRGFEREEEERQCAAALNTLQHKWGFFSSAELVQFGMTADFAGGRYCVLQTDYGSGAYLALVVVFEYAKQPHEDGTRAMRVIGHYMKGLGTPPRWHYYYGKNEQTFSICDGVGKLLYQLNLVTGKDTQSSPYTLSPPYTLPSELP